MKCFITGVTGSLGQQVCQMLLLKGHEVIGYSRDENKQGLIPNKEKLTLYLGDVRDEKRLLEATRNVDLIFHFAALKHVEKVEANPEEGISTNVLGTMNVLYAQRINEIPKVILSATDKGAYPINVYGATKLLAERLTLRNPNNVVCRYGNVLASRGSVVEKFVKSLLKEKTVYITDDTMTRFWITIEEAAGFVVTNALAKGGGLKIPVMRGAHILTLAQAVAEVLSIKAFEIKNIGARPGEKVHECLRTEYEGEEVHSNTVVPYAPEELVEILKPIIGRIL